MAFTLSLQDSWSEGGVAGKRRTAKRFKITGSPSASQLTAADFGFRKIEESSPITDASNGSMYITCPSYDGSVLYIGDVGAGASDGTVNATSFGVITITDPGWWVTVKGY